jgi:hypothetical protein
MDRCRPATFGREASDPWNTVALILESLGNGMSLDEIDSAFDHSFPHEALHEVLKVASEFTDSFHVAA